MRALLASLGERGGMGLVMESGAAAQSLTVVLGGCVSCVGKGVLWRLALCWDILIVCRRALSVAEIS